MSARSKRPFSVWTQGMNATDSMRLMARFASLDAAVERARKAVQESRGGLSTFALVRNEETRKTLERFALKGYRVPLGWEKFDTLEPRRPKALVWRTVVRSDQSPMNKRRWLLELDCGHEVWVTTSRQPHRHQHPCDPCAEAP